MVIWPELWMQIKINVVFHINIHNDVLRCQIVKYTEPWKINASVLILQNIHTPSPACINILGQFSTAS